MSKRTEILTELADDLMEKGAGFSRACFKSALYCMFTPNEDGVMQVEKLISNVSDTDAFDESKEMCVSAWRKHLEISKPSVKKKRAKNFSEFLAGKKQYNEFYKNDKKLLDECNANERSMRTILYLLGFMLRNKEKMRNIVASTKINFGKH